MEYDAELDDPDESAIFVASKCNVSLTLLTSHNAWTINDQSTSAGYKSETETQMERGRMCEGENAHVSSGTTTSWMNWGDWVASTVAFSRSEEGGAETRAREGGVVVVMAETVERRLDNFLGFQNFNDDVWRRLSGILRVAVEKGEGRHTTECHFTL